MLTIICRRPHRSGVRLSNQTEEVLCSAARNEECSELGVWAKDLMLVNDALRVVSDDQNVIYFGLHSRVAHSRSHPD